jgi:hypothetical protein
MSNGRPRSEGQENFPPSAVHTVEHLARREVPGLPEPGGRARAVVELSRALGGMTMRALLGATFLPDS